MFPSSPSADAPFSERRVFERFRDGLPPEWVVLHARRYLLEQPGGRRPKEGEIDFLVLDPARGLVALEVKGGEVRCERGRWISRAADGSEHAIDDPAKQASDGIYAIDRWLQRQDRLKAQLPPPRHRIAFGHGVVLPATRVDGDLGPGLPRQILLDTNDLEQPKRALDALFDYQCLAGPPLPPSAVDTFLDVMMPPLGLVRSLGARLDAERAEILRLTEDQLTALASLERMRRLAIAGSAGTGKTLLAAEKARRLAASGQRTLLLCYNRPLADHLAAGADGYEVQTFHGLCDTLAKEAGLPFAVPQLRANASAKARAKVRDFWEKEAPSLLMDALGKLPERRWDALIVDEGQDFRADWWAILELALADPKQSILYVFHDPNQTLYPGELPKDLEERTFDLTPNCRNTKRIAQWCHEQIGTAPQLHRGAPEGIDVEVISCKTKKAMVEAVQHTLHRLLVEERIPSKDVVILSTRSPDNSCLAGRTKLGGATLVGLGEWEKNGQVVFSSLHRFKGLEADFVILCDVEPGKRTSDPKHLYVAGSRARLGLVVVCA